MILRTFLLFIFAGVFSLSEAFAGREGDKENQPPYSNVLKRSLNDKSPPKSPKRQKQAIVDEISPQSKEKKTFSNARKQLVPLAYPTGETKKPVGSPVARKLLIKAVKETNHYVETSFDGKTVYKAKGIFNWDDKVLSGSRSSEWIWKTNLKRAEQGLAPIGYKGISGPIAVEKLDDKSAKVIIKKQKLYLINLHHLTQKDSGTENDPICELTQISHKGNNACFILESTKDVQNQIVYSDLEKDEAKILCSDSQKIVKNLLHFRKEKTHIVREIFAKWRASYWKARALDEIIKKTISDEQVNPKKPLPPRKLF